MLLTALILTPLAAGLAGLITRSHRAWEGLNLAAFGVTLLLGLRLAQLILAGPPLQEWNGFLYADALSAWMVLLISLVALASTVYARDYFRRDLAAGRLTPNRLREYYLLTPIFGFGMFAVVLANNLGILWVAVEATALASVFLVALYNQKTSLEAAWKYIILGSVGLALALLGTTLTYAAAAHTGDNTLAGLNWSHLVTVADRLDPQMMKLAFIFILVGYGTKAGMAPFHTWLPDAHSEAPTPTSAMLSGVYLKVALYGLIRFHLLAQPAVGTGFSAGLLLLFGLLSMAVAAPLILVQTNLKRLLAYSSLEHIGVICVGLGLNTPLALAAALAHAGYHALAKPLLFFAAGNIHQKFHTLELPTLGSGLLKTMPGTSPVLVAAVLAIIGAPPFGLFLTELMIGSAALSAGRWGVALVFFGALVVVFCALVRHTAKLVLGPAAAGVPPEDPAPSGVVAMDVLLAALVVFSVWMPGPIWDLLQQAVRVLGGAS